MRVAIALIVVWCWIAPAGANAVSCEGDGPELLPEADVVVVGQIYSIDEGNPSRLVLQAREYLLGSGQKTISFNFVPCQLRPRDRENTLLGDVVVVFLSRRGPSLQAVEEERGIVGMWQLPNIKAGIRMRELRVELTVSPDEVGVGQEIELVHTLTNDGREALVGCIGADSRWSFKDAVGSHSVVLDEPQRPGIPECVLDVDLEAGESVTWTRVTGVPTAVEQGVVDVIARIQVVLDRECRDRSCGHWDLRSDAERLIVAPR